MADEQKQYLGMSDETESSSDDDQHVEILLRRSTDSDSKNALGETEDSILNTSESRRHSVSADIEVQENDVFIIEQLPDEVCHEENSDERLETKIFYEYPSDLDEECSSPLPQACFDNTENIRFLESPKILNVSEIRAVGSPKTLSKIQQDTKVAGASDAPSCSSRETTENPFLSIFEVTYVGPKGKHSTEVPDDLKKSMECPDYTSDEFADVEDNLRDSSSSESNEATLDAIKSNDTEFKNAFLSTMNLSQKPQAENEDLKEADMKFSISPKNGLVRSKASKSKSDDKGFASNIFEPSCSGYVPQTKSKPVKTYHPTAKVPESKSVRRGTMTTISEEPDLEKNINENPKPTEPVVSKTNPLKAKTRVGKRKDKCNVCNVRLGLCAIKCRCGGYYCAKHRYDKEHNCTFDYKTMGAEEIRKNNPRVVAEKIRKL